MKGEFTEFFGHSALFKLLLISRSLAIAFAVFPTAGGLYSRSAEIV